MADPTVSPAPLSPTPVRFGDFELDLRTAELRRNGSLLKLQPQPAKVLVALVSRAGEVVTRQELAQQVWGSDTFVDFEQGLNYAIRQIRTVLEDDVDHPRFLETLPKRGYRFAAPVTEARTPQPPIAPPTPPPRKNFPRVIIYSLAAVVAVVLIFVGKGWRAPTPAAAPAIQSLAVLPLQNLSPDPEQDYFSEGMTDELITNLAKITRLKVISHTSVERYKGAKLSLPEIANQLGVDAVVEGSVTRSGDRVRITAQLIDARSDQHLWAESYERDLKDTLALQDEVARRIATAVGLQLTPDEQERLTTPDQVDPATHEAYLRALFFHTRVNCTSFRTALTYFQQAADRIPNFAPATLGLADTYFHLADWACEPQKETFAKSRAAALRALELNPRAAGAHAVLGKLAFYHDWDWNKADQEFQQALALDPNDAPTHSSYAIFLISLGHRDRALAEMDKARLLDPVSEWTNSMASYIFYLSHQYDQGIDQAKKTIELYPQSGSAYYWLGQSYEQKHMYGEAVDAYLHSGTHSKNGPTPWSVQARLAYQQGGISAYWNKQFDEKQNQDPVGTCWKSFIYGHMGDKPRTLQWLEWGYEHQCDGLQFLTVEPIYGPLHSDPRYQTLVSRLHLQ